MTRRPLLIAGPTASGKSALALELARRDGGFIINADASQVYECWRILTARPDSQEFTQIPHRLFGHVGCDRQYSTGSWLSDLKSALSDARRRVLRPIIVGGTGLYFSALTNGLADIPPIPEDVRSRSDRLLRNGGHARLRDDLARLDPETLATIDANNPMRLQRAWDVVTATGRGLVDWHQRAKPPLLPEADCDRIVLKPDKAMQNNNICLRLNLMLERGVLDECQRNIELEKLSRPSARVIGARHFWASIDGTMTLPAAIEATATDTRRLAKRQMTWFRNRMAQWQWLDPVQEDLPTLVPPG